jgi:hypothetical protein
MSSSKKTINIINSDSSDIESDIELNSKLILGKKSNTSKHINICFILTFNMKLTPI